MVQSKVTFRISKEEDTKLLIECLMEPGVLRWFPMYNYKEVEDAARHWISYYKKESCITVEYEGIPCGVANLYIQPYQKLKHQCLFAIIVSEKFRGKGIGTLFLKELQRLAKEKFHIELLHLEVYENNPTLNLYLREGFQIYGRHEHFLKEPDGYRTKILMQKTL